MTVAKELIRGWEYFDRRTYATQVLAHSIAGPNITIRDPDALAAADASPNLSVIRFTPNPHVVDLSKVENKELVSVLDLSNALRINDFSPVPDFSNLKLLNLESSRIRVLPRLPSGLGELRVKFCSFIESVDSLMDGPPIRTLVFLHMRCLKSFSPIGTLHGSLKSLVISGEFGESSRDLNWLSSLTSLRDLRVAPPFAKEDYQFVLGDSDDLSYLPAAVELRELVLDDASGLQSLAGLSNTLQILNLSSCTSLRSVQILETSANLTELALSGAEHLVDFSFLRSMPLLRKLNLSRCAQFSSLDLISSDAELISLDISRTSVRDLTDLERQRSLRQLNLVGCDPHSLDPLMSIPSCLLIVDTRIQERLPKALSDRHRVHVVGLPSATST